MAAGLGDRNVTPLPILGLPVRSIGAEGSQPSRCRTERSPPSTDHSNPDSSAGSAEDRAIGALVGLACGDAVGTTLEFRSPGSFEPIDDMVGGGPFGLEPGQWTDDTSMALCLAESIIETGGMDQADQMRRYLRWRDDGHLSSNGRCFDIGFTTNEQLSRFELTGEPVDPDVDDEACANGSLMRLAPVAIRWSDPVDVAQMAAESSRPTHAADRPVDACRLMATMIAALISGTTWSEVTSPDFWNGGELHAAIGEIADGSYRIAGRRIRGSGYCVEALEAALWAVDGASDFRSAVLRAANLGDDADTTAAIAGQLAGARWGRSGIPVEWLERLTMGDEIVAMARALHAACVGHRPDRTGCGRKPMTDEQGTQPTRRWEHDDTLHAWWVTDQILAGEYPASYRGRLEVGREGRAPARRRRPHHHRPHHARGPPRSVRRRPPHRVRAPRHLGHPRRPSHPRHGCDRPRGLRRHPRDARRRDGPWGRLHPLLGRQGTDIDGGRPLPAPIGPVLRRDDRRDRTTPGRNEEGVGTVPGSPVPASDAATRLRVTRTLAHGRPALAASVALERVVDRFDVVPVGVADEHAVVAGVVLGPDPGLVEQLGPQGERRVAELVHLVAGRGPKRDV